jgi:DNA polymerase-3 subunit gamma/tau
MYITGVSGTGKTTLAKIIVKSILCKDKVEGNPCNICNYCKGVDATTSDSMKLVDYMECNASNYGKDEVQTLVTKVVSRQGFGHTQPLVIYINELQEIKSKVALTNLLDVLEFPPNNIYWIFASMEDVGIHDAIKDRGTTYKLNPLSQDIVSNRIEYVATQEGYPLSKELKDFIGENSNGSLRRGIDLLEKTIDMTLKTVQDVAKELDILTSQDLDKFVSGLINKQLDVLEMGIKPTQELVKNILFKLNCLLKVKNNVGGRKWLFFVKDINYQNVQVETIVNLFEELHCLLKDYYIDKNVFEFRCIKGVM